MNTNNWKFSSLSIDVSASNSNSFGFYISGEKNTNIEIYNCNINIGINRDSLFGIYVDADSIENLKTIKNNILGGAIGIAFIGQYTYYATSPTGFNIVIDSNNISEFSNVGISLQYSIKANSISYNNISSRSVVPGKIYGIFLETFPSVDSLMNNKISLNNTSSDCYGIYLYACVDTSFIANNEIRKINNNI